MSTNPQSYLLKGQNTVTYSTEHINAREKFDYWVDTVCKQLVFVDCKRHARGPFEGVLRTATLGDIVFAEMYSVPQTFYRSRQQLAQLNTDSLIASIPLTFKVDKSINQRPIPSAKGDISIYDGGREQRLAVKDRIAALIVAIPKIHIQRYLPSPERFTGRVISTAEPSGFLASNYLRNMASQIGSIESDITTTLSDNLMQLFALAVSANVSDVEDKAPAVRNSLYIQICRYIEANIQDHSLSPKKIADAHRISLRYLYTIFEEQQQTVNRFIILRRLQRIKDVLTCAGKRHLSITAIALDFGYKDSSHFSRSFKQEFGCTAREWRERSLTEA